jgi:F-type H+-transporting ATPase subunit delta
MSETATIARPYAKAIFAHALAANKLSKWSDILHYLAIAASDKEMRKFIRDPAATKAQQVELLLALFAKPFSHEKATIEEFVIQLVDNKRLNLLPDIKVLFEVLRAEQEKTLDVKVISFSELSSPQQEQLKSKLRKRLQRKDVTLNLGVDKSLMGGMVIYAGDLVIDGSVQGKLNKISTHLAL